jgi:PAS domain S-box-containing protein
MVAVTDPQISPVEETVLTNNFVEDLADTHARTKSEHQLDNVREQGGFFVEAVRLTRMPMIVTDATLPGNPIIFANEAFIMLSGYALDEITGQDPHFMDGPDTDLEAVREYQSAMDDGRDANVELVQHRKGGEPFRAMLFSGPLDDGQGRVLNHFLSYLDVTRRYEAEQSLRLLTDELEAKVRARTAELSHANALLTQLVHEKEALLAEVNHRAKNSLTIASSLLGIQGRRHADPAVRDLFSEAQDRLVAMSRVHDLLSKSETAQRVNLATYLSDLCEALRPITEQDNCILLTVESDDSIVLHADVAIPLGIIATELITNAVKYAFPPPLCGTIAVSARRVDGSVIEFSVRDDGRGMGEIREGSLGYGLVKTLVKGLRGDLRVSDRPGVSVAVVFQAEEETGSAGRPGTPA